MSPTFAGTRLQTKEIRYAGRLALEECAEARKLNLIWPEPASKLQKYENHDKDWNEDGDKDKAEDLQGQGITSSSPTSSVSGTPTPRFRVASPTRCILRRFRASQLPAARQRRAL